jgi:signal transduction histidine kinase
MPSAAYGRRASYESARLELARLQLTGQDARADAMRQVTQTTARALGVDRVGIWAFKGTDGGMVGVCQYDPVSGTFPRTGLPDGLALPRLLAEIFERRVVAIAEARLDARTAELRAAYLETYGIRSIMLAPVIRDAKVVGVICCEQVGAVRLWSLEDVDFAACAADMAAMFLEQADRLDLEASLRARRESELGDERMASLGRLARSVAHDIANVLGTLDLIGVDLETDQRDDVGERGRQLRRAIRFGSDLVGHLMLFGRESAPPSQTVDLAAFLGQVEPTLRQLLREARLEIEVSASGAVPIAIDPAELSQLLLNLSINAAEAIAPGGRVRIELREPRANEGLDPSSIVLAVADDGRGMDPAIVSHVFEPYFTTKGEGHGIGLSTVYGIIKGAGGTIQVDSAPGGGTTFRIALPRAAALRPPPNQL